MNIFLLKKFKFFDYLNNYIYLLDNGIKDVIFIVESLEELCFVKINFFFRFKSILIFLFLRFFDLFENDFLDINFYIF